MPLRNRAVVVGAVAAILSLTSGAAIAAEGQTGPEVQRRRDELAGLRSERARVEIELHALRRRVPPLFDPTALGRRLQSVARRAELTTLDVTPLPEGKHITTEGEGNRSVETHRVRVSGSDRYDKVHLFLSFVARFAAALDFATLTFVGEGGSAAFDAVIAVPAFGEGADVPPAEARSTSRDAGGGRITEVIEREIAAEREALARLSSTREALAAAVEGHQPARIVDALAIVAREADGHPVTLTRVRSSAGQTVFEGRVLEAALPSLEAALRTAGFEINLVEASPAGACKEFTIAARLTRIDLPPTSVLDNGLFGARPGAGCPAGPAPLEARQVGAGAGGSGDGGLVSIPPQLEAPAIEEVRLVAVAKRGGGDIGFLLGPGGAIWEVQAGARLRDAVVDRVEGEALRFTRGDAPGGSGTLKLFEGGEPPAWPADPELTGEPLSIDMEADLASVVALLARFSGASVALESGTGGRVRISARNAPWDWVLQAALKRTGLGYRIDRTYIRIGPPKRLDRLVSLNRDAFGPPVTLTLMAGEVAPVLQLLAGVLGLDIDPPGGARDRVVLFVDGVPASELLELVLATRGWTSEVDGTRVRIDVPTTGR